MSNYKLKLPALVAVVFATGCVVVGTASAARPGQLLGQPEFVGETRSQIVDIRSAPLRLPDGTFLVRGETNHGAGDDGPWFDSINSRLRMLKLNRHRRMVGTYSRSPIGRGVSLGGRRDFWNFLPPVYLGAGRVAITGSTDGIAPGSLSARTTIVFNARSGKLDSAFGRKGVLLERFTSHGERGSLWSRPRSTIARPGGGILECGVRSRGDNSRFPKSVAYVRGVDRNGHVDSPFGVDGVITRFPPTGGFGSECTVLERSKGGGFIAAGYDTWFDGKKPSELWVRRFNSDGSTDTSFGSGGTFAASVALPGRSLIPSFAVTSNDESTVVVARAVRTSSPDSAVVFKLDPNGVLDSTFGDGPVALDGDVQSVAMATDGSIMLGGKSRANRKYAPFVSRLTSSGALDSTFAGSGFHAFGALGGSGVSRIFLGSGSAWLWSFAKYREVKLKGGGYDRALRSRQRFARIGI